MRKILIAGNWKMNLDTNQASLLVHRLQQNIKVHRDIEIVLAPSMLVLQPVSTQIDRRKFRLAAQNAYHKDEGAYTGEVSFTMLRDLVHYVLIGHSERRHVFGESLDDVAAKMSACVRNKITPILCVGETSIDKAAGETERVVHDQLVTALSGLISKEIEGLVVAYEPVWAIGTGQVANPGYAVKVAKVIRHNISELYGKKAASTVRVLYGGSVKPDNATSFLQEADIDGLLVGGASINYQQFVDIIDAGFKASHFKGLK